MNLKRLTMVLAGAVLSLPALVAAENFDGSKPFLCAVTEILECYENEGCTKETTQATRAPEFLHFDLKKKTLTAHTDNEPRTSKIQSSVQHESVLVVQGYENLRSWTVTVTSESGEMSGAVAGEEIAFVIFGNCIHP